MSNIALTVESINAMKPLDIVTNENVRARFIQIWDTLWGAGSGEAAYERESLFFNNKLRDDEKLQRATRFSIFTCFIDLAVAGLSLEPGTRALCYLQGRSYCIGKHPNGDNIYEGRLTLTISGYGELVMRARAGQIRYADNPVLVYEEDTFSFGDMNGQKVVNYMCNLPHKSNHIIAAFLRITRPDGSLDYAVMLEEDWMRLQRYSLRNNQRYDKNTKSYVGNANPLYTANNGGIDSGFLAAKLIKHAFKTYPKVRIGNGTELESAQDDNKQQEIDDFYGVAAPAEAPAMPADPNPPFGNQPDTSAGVVIDPAKVEVPEQGAAEDDGTF